MARLLTDRPLLHLTSELGRVMSAAKAREAAGERVLHLERGEPDFDTPQHICEALARAARDGHTHYPDQRGERSLREALVAKLARENRMDVHVDDITVTAGGTHGLFIAMQALLAQGDELLVLSPHWMAIPKLVAFVEGASYRSLPTYLDLQSGAWTAAAFADHLRAALTPATRGIYFNTPNNPTGVVLTDEQLQAIATVALERDLWVISDEAYEHLLYDGAEHRSIASLPGMAERTISVYTFSKSYAMTGWRVGYVVTPPAMRAVMGPLLAFYTTHGVFPSSQLAALAAVTGPQDEVWRMRDAYDERRQLLLAGLADCGALVVPPPKGAFYVFADISRARGDRDVWSLIDEWLTLGVAALPGTAFGPAFGDWVRMALCTRRDDVVEAARRLAQHHHVGARS